MFNASSAMPTNGLASVAPQADGKSHEEHRRQRSSAAHQLPDQQPVDDGTEGQSGAAASKGSTAGEQYRRGHQQDANTPDDASVGVGRVDQAGGERYAEGAQPQRQCNVADAHVTETEDWLCQQPGCKPTRHKALSRL